MKAWTLDRLPRLTANGRPFALGPVSNPSMARGAAFSFSQAGKLNVAKSKLKTPYADLIPSLSEGEFAQLKANIIADGCRDALVVWDGKLLDGHNRYRICTEHDIGFDTIEKECASKRDAEIWIINNQFGRRNLTNFQRAELALKLKPRLAAEAKKTQGMRTDLCQNSDKSDPVDTKKDLAAVAGVSHDTIHKASYLLDHADDDAKEKLRHGDVSVSAEYRKAKKQELSDEQTARKGAKPKLAEADTYQLIECDVASLAEHVSGVDCIITDPPYDEESLDCYDALAAFASQVLKPGGSLICMVGQSYLPDVLTRLGAHLTYQWTAAYLTPGGQSAQLWQRRVNTFWKPLLWFVKGTYAGDWIGDVCRSEPNDNDKRFHHWGQSESGMSDIIERFSDPGQIVCDPFCGGGTTGVSAVARYRCFIGSDASVDAIATTAARLEETFRARG